MPKQLISLRVDGLTRKQLTELAAKFNTTQARIVAIAIDRMFQQEIATMTSKTKLTKEQRATIQQLKEHWRVDTVYRYTGDGWGDPGEFVCLPELQSVLDMWRTSDPDMYTGEEHLAEMFGQLRFYNSDTPGDYEVVGEEIE